MDEDTTRGYPPASAWLGGGVVTLIGITGTMGAWLALAGLGALLTIVLVFELAHLRRR